MINLLKNLHCVWKGEKRKEEPTFCNPPNLGGFGEKQRNKVSDGCIRDIWFNSHLYQKLIGVLV